MFAAAELQRWRRHRGHQSGGEKLNCRAGTAIVMHVHQIGDRVNAAPLPLVVVVVGTVHVTIVVIVVGVTVVVVVILFGGRQHNGGGESVLTLKCPMGGAQFVVAGTVHRTRR